MGRKQKGFTLIEIWICIVILIALATTGAFGYVVYHFVSKFW